MASRLVFIHGRSQEGKDAPTLKDFWTQSWREGLRKSGRELRLDQYEIKFVYYGQSLFDRVSGKAADQIAEIIIRGARADAAERDFMLAVLREVAARHGVGEAQIDSIEPESIRQRGIQNWEWVQRILIALDRNVPYASTASIAAATADVYQYLFNAAVTDAIDEGVREAMVPEVPTVVVAHSLGTVVAYKMLKEAAVTHRWNVPLFVTLGSPLAITAIRKRLQPLKYPQSVEHWFNAMDPRDVVSLYPLTREHFAVDRDIENKTDVDNHTANRHSIEGYLGDRDVAACIAVALTR